MVDKGLMTVCEDKCSVYVCVVVVVGGVLGSGNPQGKHLHLSTED